MADTVSSVTNANAAPDVLNTGSSVAVTNGLDKNAFLSLLMTQIQHQDPMNPTDDKEFISQMAQFTSLEQMQQMNEKMTTTATATGLGDLAGMIGHTVSVQDPTSSDSANGKVSGISYKNSTPYLTINGTDYDASWVTQIN